MPASQKRESIIREDYSVFIREVFARDRWCCRRCSSREQLQCHHIVKRSNIRLDVLWNCITLCSRCHQLAEDFKILLLGKDPDGAVDANDIVKFRYPQHV